MFTINFSSITAELTRIKIFIELHIGSTIYKLKKPKQSSYL